MASHLMIRQGKNYIELLTRSIPLVVCLASTFEVWLINCTIHRGTTLATGLFINDIMSSSSQQHAVLLIVVFVSLGGLFVLASLSAALCFLLLKKKKDEEYTQKTEVADVEEHLRVHGATAPGPGGPHAVVLSIDDDVQVHHEVEKTRDALPDHGPRSGSALPSN
ncbi:hypothetical protein H6P81_001749 [Aristolochia fimbriata]|uniref:Uncharacterized protein n=1 Tax=Aristolochia fimbriata TaxID=158543 RepID=A0AAV7FAZ9_ARIFI|nr:hypothetical protein H6P81_001749 [Aristolochia fimbriata]